MLDFLNNIPLTWSTMGVIIIFVIIALEGTNYILSVQKKKMICYTIMTLLNDIADLSVKNGHKSWIEYIYKTYGSEKGKVYINQIYVVLSKNRINDSRYNDIIQSLKEYLLNNKG